ncbi:MAG: signal peptide peptidase SppA [Deltaproteobacteria bacterium]|nr:signal peptide peptidase SppA [Deltaproteobacteria bacterium]MBW2306568.1 signal peptide peptidase SppA [Deltaproteobacteria bacterium]
MNRHPVLTGLGVIATVFVLFVISIYLYARYHQVDDLPFAPKEKIGIVEIKGLITDSGPIIEQIRKFLKNKRVKAIILRINSPGGAVGPSQEIYAEIRRAAKEIKIVASLGSVAASGGYYVACPAHKIVANPGTITGSIGVLMEFANIRGLMHKIGLKGVVIKSGEYKDIGSPLRDMTPDEEKILQSLIDDVHEQFIQAVAESRNLLMENVRALSDGRIISGQQAQALGLVDQMGNFYDAVRIAADLAEIPGEPTLVYPERRRRFSLWDFVFGSAAEKLKWLLWGKYLSLNYLYVP